LIEHSYSHPLGVEIHLPLQTRAEKIANMREMMLMFTSSCSTVDKTWFIIQRLRGLIPVAAVSNWREEIVKKEEVAKWHNTFFIILRSRI